MWIPLQLLSLACWGLINVLDSILIKHYDRHPMVALWHQGVFSVITLAVLWFFFDTETTWMVPFLLAGVLAYIGDIIFFMALDRIDVSVTNIAWALLSVFLAMAGFIFLRETWSLFESMGAGLVFGGALLLSLWQRKIGNPKALLLLPLLGLSYVPFYFLQDLALKDGQTTFVVFFWPVLSREVSNFVVGLTVPSLRRKILGSSAHMRIDFHLLNAFVIALFFAASYLTVLAYSVGPLSLVAVLSNVQPFLTLFFAGACAWVLPRFAPREILSRQSVSLKILCFCIVFSGLALIALSH